MFVSGIAGRYAAAMFEIAEEDKAVERIEGDLDRLQAAIDESDDLRDVLTSPVYRREDQANAMAAVAKALELGSEVTNVIALMASRRRLFVLPQMITGFRQLVAEMRGEVTAEVTAAHALSDEQRTALAAALKEKLGQDVTLDVSVDESLIGGLVVRVGSQLIDSSIRARLGGLQTMMRGVG
ncbi:MAG: F0F1 ATP synthase subunit delta [Pseudomonadota bacterium]